MGGSHSHAGHTHGGGTAGGRHKGKLKRFRGRLGKRSDSKKAVITLAEGSRIDVSTGL